MAIDLFGRRAAKENADLASENDEATLKRVRFSPDGGALILQPENPNYSHLVFVGEQMNTVRILGKATHFISCVK